MININDKWNTHKLSINKIDGEYQISLSEIIKDSINLFKDKKYKKILDLGCGKGRNSLYFAQHGFEVFASDISVKSMNSLKNKIYKKNISNIKVHNFSFTDIQFEDNFFDVVVSTSVLHHAKIKDIEKGISEIYRVLKPHGCFIFDILSKEDASYGLGEVIEKDTFVGSSEGEEDIPHHYTDIKELSDLLKEFREANVYKNEYTIDNLNGKKYSAKVFDVIAYKYGLLTPYNW